MALNRETTEWETSPAFVDPDYAIVRKMDADFRNPLTHNFCVYYRGAPLYGYDGRGPSDYTSFRQSYSSERLPADSLECYYLPPSRLAMSKRRTRLRRHQAVSPIDKLSIGEMDDIINSYVSLDEAVNVKYEAQPESTTPPTCAILVFLSETLFSLVHLKSQLDTIKEIKYDRIIANRLRKMVHTQIKSKIVHFCSMIAAVKYGPNSLDSDIWEYLKRHMPTTAEDDSYFGTLLEGIVDVRNIIAATMFSPVIIKFWRIMLHIVKVGLSWFIGYDADFSFCEDPKPFPDNVSPIWYIFDGITEFASGAYQYFIKGNELAFTHSGSKYCKWMEDVLRIESQVNAVRQPHMCGKDDIAINDFLTETDRLIAYGNDIMKAISKHKADTHGYSVAIVSRHIAILTANRGQVVSQHRLGQLRPEPLALLLYGESTVGKSMLTQLLLQLYDSVTYSLPEFDRAKIYYWPLNNKHADMLSNAHEYLVFDDVAKIKPRAGAETPPELDALIHIVNSVPMIANKAEVDMKGSTFISPSMVIATTNVKDLNVRAYMSEPAATLRRMKYVLTVTPRKECRTEQGALDFSKIPYTPKIDDTDIHDIWDITVELCTAVMREPHYTVVAKGSFTDIMPYLIQIFVEHNKVQDALQMSKTSNCFSICKACYNPSKRCICVVERGTTQLHNVTPSVVSNELHDVSGISRHVAGIRQSLHNTTEYTRGLSKRFIPNQFLHNVSAATAAKATRIPTQLHDVTVETRDEIAEVQPLENVSMSSTLDAMLGDAFSVDCDDLFDITEAEGHATHIGSAILGFSIGAMALHRIILKRLALPNILRSAVVDTQSAMRALGDKVEALINTVDFNIVKKGLAVLLSTLAIYKAYRYFTDEEAQEEAMWSSPFMNVPRSNIYNHTDIKSSLFSHEQKSISDDAFKDKLTKHLVRVQFTGDRASTGVGLILEGSYIIIPQHTYVPNATLQIRPFATTGPHINAYTTSSPDGQYVYSIPGKDLCVLFLTGYVAMTKKSILQYFPTDDSTIPRGTDVYRPTLRLETSLGGLPFYSPDIAWQSLSGNSEKIPNYPGNTAAVGKPGICYAQSDPGACGTPCVLTNRGSAGVMIGGLHICGNRASNKGWAVVVTQSELKIAIDAIRSPLYNVVASEGIDLNPYNLPSVHIEHDLHDKSTLRYVTSDLLYVGTDAKWPRSKPQHDVEYTLLLKHMRETDYIPPSTKTFPIFKCGYLSEVDAWYSYKAKALDSLGSQPKGYSDSVLDAAMLSLQRRIAGAIESYTPHPFLTDFQAINGVPGVPFLDAIPKSKGAGYPLGGKKRDFLVPSPTSEQPEAVKFNDVAQSYVEKLETIARSGERLFPVFKCHPKSEPVGDRMIPLADGKEVFGPKYPRVFAGAPLIWSHILRKYFLPVIKFIQENNFHTECAVGIDACSGDWMAIADYLDQHPNIVLGDYSDYDTSACYGKVSHRSLTLLYWMFWQLYPQHYTVELDNLIRSLLTDLLNACYLMDKDIVMARGPNPSGQNMTVIHNCLINSLLVRCAWIDLGLPIEDFNGNVTLLTYGDDNIMGISDDSIQIFNFVTLQNSLKSVGVKFTTYDKSPVGKERYSLFEGNFLKRGFLPCVFDGVKLMLAPLDPGSFSKMLTFRSETRVDLYPHAVAVIDCLHREAVQHGEDEYNRYQDYLIQLCERANIPFTPRSWRDWMLEFMPKYVQNGHIVTTIPLIAKLYTDLVTYQAVATSLFDVGALITGLNQKNLSGVDHGRLLRATVINEALQSYSPGAAPQMLYLECSGRASLVQAEGEISHSPIGLNKRLAKTNEINSCMVQETTTFIDEEPGLMLNVPNEVDPTRRQIPSVNYQLADFLRRPVIISEQFVTPGSPAGSYPNYSGWPWYDWATNSTVADKLRNYHLFRGKLMLKFVINGTPFHYGKILVAYTPLKDVSEVYDNHIDEGTSTSGWMACLCRNSQKPHVYLDPTSDTGACMCLPFVWANNAVRIQSVDEWKELGYITSNALLPTQAASSSVAKVSVTVFAWIEDAEISVPTHDVTVAESSEHSALDYGPQAEGDEYDGPISRPAMAVANAAGKAINVPVIGKFAMATEIGASAVGKIASIFGFSKPATIATTGTMRQDLLGNTANTSGADVVKKLTLDPKQEVTVDPSVVGCGSDDEMAIMSIAQRHSIFSHFDWNIDQIAGTQLWKSSVSPLVIITDTSAAASDHFSGSAVYQPTALGFASLPFEYWSGTLIYKFDFQACKFHKGRLKISWDPVSDPNTAETNQVYSQIIDLAKTRTCEFAVVWGQANAYAPVIYDSAPVPFWGLTGTDITSGNGHISVNVMNTLLGPDSLGTDVRCIVSVRAGDDFELRAPVDINWAISRFSGNLVGAPPCDGGPLPLMTGVNFAEGGEFAEVDYGAQAEGEEVDVDTLDPVDSPNIADLNGPPQPSLLDLKSKVFFGDPVISFRDLLKRYNLSSVNDVLGIIQSTGSYNNGSGTDRLYSVYYQNTNFPGYTNTAGKGALSVQIAATAVKTELFNITLLNYLTPAYVARRGGLRHKYVFFTQSGFVANTPGNIRVYRSPTYRSTRARQISMAQITERQYGQAKGLTFASKGPQKLMTTSGAQGVIVESTPNTLTANVELPMYHHRRFYNAREMSGAALLNQHGNEANSFLHTLEADLVISPTPGGTDPTITRLPIIFDYVAAADDFSLAWFIHAPCFAVHSSIESSVANVVYA
jgi:hypothetical protein